MQPAAPLPSDIQSLSDWVFRQFGSTDAVQVKNILNQPYHFRYCISEAVEQPDQYTKTVTDRQYREQTFEADEEGTLMGAAAYIFVEGVARAYVLKNQPDKPTALEALVAAAQRVILGNVDVYAQPVQKAAPAAAGEPAETPAEKSARPTAPAQEQAFPSVTQAKTSGAKSAKK